MVPGNARTLLAPTDVSRAVSLASKERTPKTAVSGQTARNGQ